MSATILVSFSRMSVCEVKNLKCSYLVNAVATFLLRECNSFPADQSDPGQHITTKGWAVEQTAQGDGAARPAPGNGNKRQRPQPTNPPRPDLKTEGGRRTGVPGRRTKAPGLPTELNMRKKRQLEALSRGYPGKLDGAASAPQDRGHAYN